MFHNHDNMELQNDTGRIALVYYAKLVNIVAGGKGEGIVSNDSDNDKSSAAGGSMQAARNSTANTSDNSLGQDLSSDGNFRIDGQRLYNLATTTLLIIF
jgi:hypothetical protein